jgi:hypothetical protein
MYGIPSVHVRAPQLTSCTRPLHAPLLYHVCLQGCGLVIYSQRSEAVLAMETLAGRFIWPGARTPIVLEWASKQQQQQQQARPQPKQLPQPLPQPPGLICTGFGPIPAPDSLQVRQVQPPLWHPVTQQQQVVVTGFAPGFSFAPGVGTSAVLAPGTGGHLGVVRRF